MKLTQFETFLDERARSCLKTRYPDGKTYLWGVKVGKTKSNRTKWRKIQPGDLALFMIGDGAIETAAIVTFTLQSKEVAKCVWGLDTDGTTWECIYFLGAPQRVRLNTREINRAAGIPSDRWLGINVRDEEKSLAIRDYLRNSGKIRLS